MVTCLESACLFYGDVTCHNQRLIHTYINTCYILNMYLVIFSINSRRNRPEEFSEEDVLKNFTKIRREVQVPESLF